MGTYLEVSSDSFARHRGLSANEHLATRLSGNPPSSEEFADIIYRISDEIVYNRFQRVGIDLYDEKIFEQLTDEWREAFAKAVQFHARTLGKN